MARYDKKRHAYRLYFRGGSLPHMQKPETATGGDIAGEPILLSWDTLSPVTIKSVTCQKSSTLDNKVGSDLTVAALFSRQAFQSSLVRQSRQDAGSRHCTQVWRPLSCTDCIVIFPVTCCDVHHFLCRRYCHGVGFRCEQTPETALGEAKADESTLLSWETHARNSPVCSQGRRINSIVMGELCVG